MKSPFWIFFIEKSGLNFVFICGGNQGAHLQFFIRVYLRYFNLWNLII
jgi:hypothetical protein